MALKWRFGRGKDHGPRGGWLVAALAGLAFTIALFTSPSPAVADSGEVRPGDQVRLEYDVDRRDKYGRVLAWVFLPDGSLLNEKLLRLGYAFHLNTPKHAKYIDRMNQATLDGRAAERGLWATAGARPHSRTGNWPQ